MVGILTSGDKRQKDWYIAPCLSRESMQPFLISADESQAFQRHHKPQHRGVI
jgi:hypothetical protein